MVAKSEKSTENIPNDGGDSNGSHECSEDLARLAL
jgi:hypothetical protein